MWIFFILSWDISKCFDDCDIIVNCSFHWQSLPSCSNPIAPDLNIALFFGCYISFWQSEAIKCRKRSWEIVAKDGQPAGNGKQSVSIKKGQTSFRLSSYSPQHRCLLCPHFLTLPVSNVVEPQRYGAKSHILQEVEDGWYSFATVEVKEILGPGWTCQTLSAQLQIRIFTVWQLVPWISVTVSKCLLMVNFFDDCIDVGAAGVCLSVFDRQSKPFQEPLEPLNVGSELEPIKEEPTPRPSDNSIDSGIVLDAGNVQSSRTSSSTASSAVRPVLL